MIPALGLDRAVVGHQATARGDAAGQPAELTGTVIEVTGGPEGTGPAGQESVALRVSDADAAASGAEPRVYEFGTLQFGQTRMSVVRGYLHLPAGAGPAADAAARAVRERWSSVLDGLLGESTGDA